MRTNKQKVTILPKQTTGVCNNQLDSLAVAQLPHLLLLIQS